MYEWAWWLETLGLALRRDMVPRPPENILSTTTWTADPVKKMTRSDGLSEHHDTSKNIEKLPRIARISRPGAVWVWKLSSAAKSSWLGGSLKPEDWVQDSSSSYTVLFSFRLNLEVYLKSIFWGDLSPRESASSRRRLLWWRQWCRLVHGRRHNSIVYVMFGVIFTVSICFELVPRLFLLVAAVNSESSYLHRWVTLTLWVSSTSIPAQFTGNKIDIYSNFLEPYVSEDGVIR